MGDADADRAKIEATLNEAVASTGGTVRPYPRPGVSSRRIVLEDRQDDEGRQYEEVVLEVDGTLRVTGMDQGPTVSRFFGPSITSYHWVYVVPPERVPLLTQALGGSPGDDALDLLAEYHRREGAARMGLLLRGKPVRADFDNWHS